MERVGPAMAEDSVICVRKKLEFGYYYVDKVTVYESAIGVDAL